MNPVAHRLRFLALPVALSLLSGCAEGLRVRQVDAAQEKPANVLLFFRVSSSAEPGASGAGAGAKESAVAGLQESAFTVKEDDRVVGPGVDRVIVNPDLRATQATLVLLDLGGRPSAEDLDALSGAVTELVEKMGPGKRLGLYALDGAEQPMQLAPFGASLDALRAAAAKIPSYKTRDPSLNLNGGYVAALRLLKQAIPASNGPRIANLVLLARGPDRAARIDTRAVKAELKKVDFDVSRYVLGFGPDAPTAKLETFTDGAPVLAGTPAALRDATDGLAASLDERGRSFYLLSYCTPARGGEHRLKLEVSREKENAKGKPEVETGSLQYSFKADGFGAGCTPLVPDGWKNETPAVVTTTTSAAHLERRGGAKPSLAGAIPAK